MFETLYVDEVKVKDRRNRKTKSILEIWGASTFRGLEVKFINIYLRKTHTECLQSVKSSKMEF